MRDPKTKSSGTAAKKLSPPGAQGNAPLRHGQNRDVDVDAKRLLALATSQLQGVSGVLPDIERCMGAINALSDRLNRELLDLSPEDSDGIESAVRPPNPLMNWPAMPETQRAQRMLHLLSQSLDDFLNTWDARDVRILEAEKRAPAAIRKARALEVDLEKALAIIRDRQQEAIQLKRDLSQAQRAAADRSGEVERLQRATQHLRAQLDESQAFAQMLAGSTSWKLARALMLPARFMPPIVRRLGRAVLRRLVALLRRIQRFRAARVHKPPKPDFSRARPDPKIACVASGLDVIVALPDGRPPSPEILDRWVALAGPQTKIIVCAAAPAAPPPQVAFVAVPPDRDLVDHVDSLIRCAVSSTAIVVTAPVAPDAAALESFSAIFAENHRTIAACGVLVREDGLIRSAGLMAGPDGRLHADGAGEHAAGYAWSSIQPVDALTSAITAFDVDAYVHVGGLKPHPQGYAGALAAFSAAVGERALRVVRNPFARFVAPADALAPEAIKAGPFPIRRGKRVLFIDAAAPTPDRDSGSLDLVWYMRIFQDMGYEVTFLAQIDRELDRRSEDLRRMGINTPLRSDFEEPWHFLRDRGFDFDIVVLSRVTVACHLIDPVKEFAPQAKVVFDTVDLHFLREERAAAIAQSEALKTQAARTRYEEFRVMDMSDVTVVRSDVEAALIHDSAPSVRTHVVPIVRPVAGRLGPLDGRRDMMFVGGFQHAPNLDAFELLHGEIWPRIRAELPDARLRIIGSGAPPSVVDRHDPDNGFLVEGFVADLEEMYRTIRVNLAPLRYGAGLKGKLVASLCNGVPSVATDVAAEGMGLENESTVLLASDPAVFADAAVRLYTDDWLWNRVSDRGVAFAEQRFSVPVVRRRFEALLSTFAEPA